jgi:trehalose 2-sulfotransferase
VTDTNFVDFVGIAPQRSYLICATQRSGSTLLCELLKSTGVAGRPEEYFEAEFATGVPPHPRRFLEGLPPTGAGVRRNVSPPEAPWYSSLQGITSYREHLERTVRLGTTDNGVFGAKLMFNQLEEMTELARTLPEHANTTAIELLHELFDDPVYIWVSREDKVRQAVSMWRALQSRRWRGERADADHHEHDPTDETPVYSYDGIHHLVRLFEDDDRGWRAWFADNGVSALHLTYERLSSDREVTVRAVLDAIGVTPPQEWTAPEPTRRQADAISADWVAAYHRDRSARGLDRPPVDLV